MQHLATEFYLRNAHATRFCCKDGPPRARIVGMEEEIEKLEVKISYLEATVAELDEVVVEQQRTIDLLNLALERLDERLNSLIEEVGTPNRPSRRPPHY